MFGAEVTRMVEMGVVLGMLEVKSEVKWVVRKG